MSCCGTSRLSWSRGEKRCRTSLGPRWWRAARPIRRRSVSHHVTASPIAIYFTIGQMKRLILTICSLMCFSRSLCTLFIFSSPTSLFPGCKTPVFFFFFLESHLSRRVTFQDTINGGGNVRTGDLIHQSRFCYLQLSINVALDGPCVSSPPARCRLLFCPPPLTSSWRGKPPPQKTGHCDPSETPAIPAICHPRSCLPKRGRGEKVRNKERGTKGRMEIGRQKENEKRPF